MAQSSVIRNLMGSNQDSPTDSTNYWGSSPFSDPTQTDTYYNQNTSPTDPSYNTPDNSGGTNIGGQKTSTPPTPPATPSYSTVGQYSGQMGGFDSTKMQNSQDAKYSIGRVLSNFDPTQGITPDVLNALNSLGYGTWSGSGDNLTLSNITDKGKQAGLEQGYNGGDFISNYTGVNPSDHSGARWQYGDAYADSQAPKIPAVAPSSIISSLMSFNGLPSTSSGAASPSTDPFASIGGGVYYNGGWIPKAMADSMGIQTSATQPTTTSGSAGSASSGGVTIPGVGTVGDNGQLLSTDNSSPTFTPGTAAGQQAVGANLPTASGTTNPGTPTVPNATYSQTPEMQSLISQLMSRANQGTTVDPNDPVIKSQVDAFRAEQERAARNTLSDQAEQNSPYNTGAMRGQARIVNEQTGQKVASYQGQLMQQELTNRRNEIQNALNSLSGVLTQDQQNALQTELANLNASLSQAGMSVQNTQFYSSLNQQDKQFVNQLTQNERFQNMNDALSRYTLYQQNAQFAASLAQQGQLANLQAALQKAGMSQQNQQFLMSLAQNGQIAQMQQEFQRMQLAQDNNQFIASLAQQGNLAQMQNVFNYAQLAQNEGQFESSLAANAGTQTNYFDNLFGLRPGTPIPGVTSGS